VVPQFLFLKEERSMKAKTCLALAIAAGCASVATANPEKNILNNQVGVTTDIIGHIYYNVATGEVIKTPAGSADRGTSDPQWINEMYDQCGFGEWFYSPIRDSATGENTYWMDWGDIAEGAPVDSFTTLYFTEVPDPEEDGEVGFEMGLDFFDGVDWCCNINSGVASLLSNGFIVEGIPGTASGGAAWLITIDLAGTGFEFSLGNMGDTDGAGNGGDFAYGYHFNHPETLLSGVTGCGLVAPPEGVEPNSLGTEDVMALFFIDGWNVLDGFYWFGGYDCTGGAGFAWTPWGDYYLGLYGGGGNPCPADMNGDGVLDFFDVLAFLSAFSNGDLAADFVPDGTLDFFDVLEFLGQFSAGCP